MKKNFQQLTILAMACVVISCSSIKVYSDLDNTEDFTQFKTFEYYGWSRDSDQALPEMDRNRIEAAFAEEGRKLGLTRVDSNGPSGLPMPLNRPSKWM